jgi:tetratricopeptide (TPR) repeat protein
LPSAGARLQIVRPLSRSEGLFSSPEKRTLVLCLLLVVATLAAYYPVSRNAFVNFDDDHYITGNPHVLAGLNWETVTWAFSNFYEANWHPLTWISHALDCELFGLNPVGPHYENVLWHGLNAALLFLLLQSATGLTWRSLAVAAFFALHPVNVESVAWASERKNLLSLMFLLLAMLAYGGYVKKPSLGRYGLVAAAFACGLMSKPQVITFPFLLLLWDYWPLRRMDLGFEAAGGAPQPAKAPALLLEKVPFFLMSLASAVITVKAQKAGGAIHSAILYPFHLRLENAIVSYSRYVGKAFWPINLSPLYPHPLDLLRTWQVFASAMALLLVTLLVIRQRKQGYLVTGWFWFLGTLVPMIGVVQVGEQAMADRYAYLPFIGLFVMVCWGLAERAHQRQTPAIWLTVPALLVTLAFGVMTYRQVGYWRDSETLWSYALRVTDVRSYKAHFNLAMAYDQEGRYDQAIVQLGQSIDPRDDDPRIHVGLGMYAQRHGHLQDAIDQYQAALNLPSDTAFKVDALSNLGGAYRQARDYERARQSFAAALQIDPNRPVALVGMGLVAQHEGDFSQAVASYSHAMSVEPTAVGYLLLGKALEKTGRTGDAQAAYNRAAQLTNDLPQAQQAAEQLLAF